MPQPGRLAQVVNWAHQLLAEVIRPGDTLVDLTAGNGHDCLFLARQLTGSGQLLAFDIQSRALEKTGARLTSSDFSSVKISRPAVLSEPGIFLIEDGHENLSCYLAGEVRAAIANLGYLPGGDKQLTTSSETTLAAIRVLLANLVVGGRLSVVSYRGHPGGLEESRALEAFLRKLPPAEFDVLRLESTNRDTAPYLLLIERRPQERS